MPIALQFVLGLVWFLAGAVISLPYTLLANGSFDGFFVTAWMAPAMTLVLYIAYRMRRFGRPVGRRPSRWGGWFFWALVAYFCSPILLNGVSILLARAGQETMGRDLFTLRYAGLLAVPMLFVAYVVAVDGFATIVQRLRRGSTPRSGGRPPTSRNESENAIAPTPPGANVDRHGDLQFVSV